MAGEDWPHLQDQGLMETNRKRQETAKETKRRFFASLVSIANRALSFEINGLSVANCLRFQFPHPRQGNGKRTETKRKRQETTGNEALTSVTSHMGDDTDGVAWA